MVLISTEEALRVLPFKTQSLVNLYRCGVEPYLEPYNALEDTARGSWTGMVLIDQKEATLARYRGGSFEVLWHSDWSGVPSKQGRGGQSQRRFERGHAVAVLTWQRKVSGMLKEVFLPLGITEIVLSGPGFCKRELLRDGQMDHRFRVARVLDQEYVDDVYGPREFLGRLAQ